MNTEIMLAIFVALILALTITYSVNDWYRSNFDINKKQDVFYSQDFDPSKKKIYLVGSSQVHRLNATFIEKFISQTESDYEIYNLGIPADRPSRRIGTLQEIIDTKPVQVIYGITFKDLAGSARIPNTITQVTAPTKPIDALPQPWEFLYEDIPQTNIIDFSNFDNPQLITLKIIELSQQRKLKEKLTPDLPNTPFTKYEKKLSKIIYLPELMEKNYNDRERRLFTGYDNGVSGTNLNTIKKIISTLQENNIKVILISVPYTRTFLDHLDDDSIEIFTSSMKEISDEFDVEVYHFYDKYADLKIFRDSVHISMNKKSIIFSSDMAKIILDEIKS